MSIDCERVRLSAPVSSDELAFASVFERACDACVVFDGHEVCQQLFADLGVYGASTAIALIALARVGSRYGCPRGSVSRGFCTAGAQVVEETMPEVVVGVSSWGPRHCEGLYGIYAA